MSTKQRCGLALAFGLMLAFLQLLLVAADDQVVCTTQSPILPRNDLYNQYCPNEMGDKGYRACFTHRSGSLYGADISPLVNRLEVDSENIIVAKDSDLSVVERATDFTMRDPNMQFVIDYRQAGIWLYHLALDYGKHGCRNLQVTKYDRNSEYRLYVTLGTDEEDAIGIDTSGTSNISTCHKTYFIHLVKEGKKAKD